MPSLSLEVLMIGFFRAVFGLLDHTINALLGVPVFASLLAGMLFFAVLGLVVMLREAAAGRPRRG